MDKNKNWWVNVHYDYSHDVVVIRYRDVVLHTEHDVTLWRTMLEAQFATLPCSIPFDMLVHLDGLVVKPGATTAYGVVRTHMMHFCKSVYRFGGDLNTRTRTYTSTILHGVDSNLYPTYEEALAVLLHDRKQKG